MKISIHILFFAVCINCVAQKTTTIGISKQINSSKTTSIEPSNISSKNISIIGQITSSSIDLDALRFIDAAGITDETQKQAINELVLNLKAINKILPNFVNFNSISASNRKYIYPFPGIGANNYLNLLSPFDHDSSFRIENNSTAPNISSNGIQWNGSVTANTNFNPASHLNVNNAEFDIALSTIGSHLSNGTEFGAYESASAFTNILCDVGFNFSGAIGSSSISSSAIRPTFFAQVQRSGTAAGKNFVNKDSRFVFNTSTAAGTLPNKTLYLGGLNGISRFSNRTFAWASGGDSIPRNVNTEYYNAIAKYNYRLSRLPLMNLVFEGHSFFAPGSTGENYSYLDDNLDSINFKTIGYSTLAIGGSKIADIASVSRVSRVSSLKKVIPGIPIRNVLIVWIGINETITDAAVNYNALAAYLQARASEGWEIVCVTMCPKTDPSSPAWRNTYNTLIKSNSAGIPNFHFVDIDLYPQLLDPTNTTYFNADKLHLVTAGHKVAAFAIKEVLKTL